jgi:hypothetical protein
MIEYFGKFLESEEAPNPQLVVVAYFKQPIPDRVLKEMQ